MQAQIDENPSPFTSKKEGEEGVKKYITLFPWSRDFLSWGGGGLGVVGQKTRNLQDGIQGHAPMFRSLHFRPKLWSPACYFCRYSYFTGRFYAYRVFWPLARRMRLQHPGLEVHERWAPSEN
jgi:hypothetical protein